MYHVPDKNCPKLLIVDAEIFVKYLNQKCDENWAINHSVYDLNEPAEIHWKSQNCRILLKIHVVVFAEVARTRLREEGSQYRSFWQTLALVFREEGVRGLYRGLATQLVRQIPNTAIMMATYEAVVYFFQNYQQPNYN